MGRPISSTKNTQTCCLGVLVGKEFQYANETFGELEKVEVREIRELLDDHQNSLISITSGCEPE
jgi:hypothetical protein